MLLLGSLLSIVSLITATSAQDPPHGTDAQIAASQACAAIRLDLGSPIVESSGPEYTATVQDPWNLFNSVDRPTCIVYVRTASHVQAAMRSIFKFGSHYAVQAGAHSSMIEWNTYVAGFLKFETGTYRAPAASQTAF